MIRGIKKGLDLAAWKLIVVLKRADLMEIMCRRMKKRVGQV